MVPRAGKTSVRANGFPSEAVKSCVDGYDNTTRFEIEHPIEAISALSSLDGFTLLDTPDPNEWESAKFNIVALKQTIIPAPRKIAPQALEDSGIPIIQETVIQTITQSRFIKKK